MFSNKKEIITFFDELANEIDIEIEKKIDLTNDNKKILDLNVVRKEIIQKIDEIVQLNIENLAKKVHFGFLVEKNTDDKKYFGNQICFVIFNEILNRDSICYIKKKLLGETVLLKENFKENFKIQLLAELIQQSNSNIIDLTDSNANLIQQIEINDTNFEINETDFIFKFVDIKKILTLSLNVPNLRKISKEFFRSFENLTCLNLNIRNHDFLLENFSYLKNLIELKIEILVFNEENVLKPNVFKGLRNLKKLILTANCIFDIEENSFNGLDALEFLDLSSNSFKYLNGTKLECLKMLNHLRITENCGKIKIENLKYIKELKILEIQNNYQSIQLDRVDECFNLELINLTDSRSNLIEKIIFKNLKCLILDNSILDLISIENFQSLEFLDLGSTYSFNYSEIFLENLKIFFLNNNQVRKFSSVFKNLRFLKIFGVFDLFEDCFEHLNSLEYLEIEFEDLYDLEKLSIEKFKYLTKLKLIKISYKSFINEDINQILNEKKHFLVNLINSKDRIVKIKLEKYQNKSLNYIQIQSCQSTVECFENLQLSDLTKKFLIQKYTGR